MPNCATFIFHGSLNDFMPKAQRYKAVSYCFEGKPAIKDAIEAQGVPHPEVSGICVNAQWVNFHYLLQAEDQIEVFPASSSFQIPEKFSLQTATPEPRKFVLDVHLGKLAKGLRMLGFDALYQNDFEDNTIAQIALAEARIVLTRDVNLLKIKTIQWGYWLRSQHLDEQLREVIRYFGLESKFAPFTRCLECNGLLVPVDKQKVIGVLPPKTIAFFYEFWQCSNCFKVYWKGSHFERMQHFIEQFTGK